VRFEIGRAIILRDGRDCTLISTGNTLPLAMEISDHLGASSISCRVLNMHTVKPLDTGALHACAGETRALFTLEEHSRIGGLGSAIAEWAAMNRISCPLHLFGAEDSFASLTGSQAYLRALCGLTAEHVAESIAAKLAGVPQC
jgi:transketolase